MRVLHICSYFTGSKVHSELYKKLDALDVKQTVFIPIRGKQDADKNSFDLKNTCLVYEDVLKLYHRLFFFAKIKKVTKEIQKSIDIPEFDVIHTPTVFSDGAVANELHKAYGIPFIVAVRTTDMEFLTFTISKKVRGRDSS